MATELHSHCVIGCPVTPTCELNWFASPCICMVSAGGEAPVVAQARAAREKAAADEKADNAARDRDRNGDRDRDRRKAD